MKSIFNRMRRLAVCSSIALFPYPIHTDLLEVKAAAINVKGFIHKQHLQLKFNNACSHDMPPLVKVTIPWKETPEVKASRKIREIPGFIASRKHKSVNVRHSDILYYDTTMKAIESLEKGEDLLIKVEAGGGLSTDASRMAYNIRQSNGNISTISFTQAASGGFLVAIASSPNSFFDRNTIVNMPMMISAAINNINEYHDHPFLSGVNGHDGMREEYLEILRNIKDTTDEDIEKLPESIAGIIVKNYLEMLKGLSESCQDFFLDPDANTHFVTSLENLVRVFGGAIIQEKLPNGDMVISVPKGSFFDLKYSRKPEQKPSHSPARR